MYIDLLKQKRDKLNEMLDLTKNTLLGNTARSSVIYIELMGKREKIVAEVKEIQQQLEQYKLEESNKEVLSIQKETDGIIREILAKDKENQPKIQSSLDGIRDELKVFNTGKAVSNIYQQGDNFVEEMQFEFDRKK